MGSAIPHCPACSSRGTIETFERFGRRAFFCMECEHSWSAVEHHESIVVHERRVDARPSYVRSRPRNN